MTDRPCPEVREYGTGAGHLSDEYVMTEEVQQDLFDRGECPGV